MHLRLPLFHLVFLLYVYSLWTDTHGPLLDPHAPTHMFRLPLMSFKRLAGRDTFQRKWSQNIPLLHSQVYHAASTSAPHQASEPQGYSGTCI